MPLLELQSPALPPPPHGYRPAGRSARSVLESMRIITVCFTTSFLAILVAHSRICSTAMVSRYFCYFTKRLLKPQLHIVGSHCGHVLQFVQPHDHLWNGSRFGMVIAVGIYEDGLLVAKVHAFYRHCMGVSSSYVNSFNFRTSLFH